MRNRHRATWLSLVVAAASETTFASSDPREIPFELYQQHIIVVRGAIGGLKNLDLAIDTGTMVSMIDPKVAKKLRLQSDGETDAVSLNETVRVPQTTVPELEFGPFRATAVKVLVSDLSFFGPASSIDAVVGFDVLSRMSFTIDYRAKRIRLGPRDGEHDTVSLQNEFPVPVVEVEAAGERLRVLVDTGGRDLVLFPNRLQPLVGATLRVRGEYTIDHAGGRVRVKKAELTGVVIGSSRVEKAMAYLVQVPAHAYPGLNGVLGVSSLGWKRVHFDFERGTLGWEK